MRVNHETRYKMFHKKDQADLVRLFPLAKMLTDFLLCLLKKESRDIPGGPVVKTLPFYCRGQEFDRGSSYMPHDQKKKKNKKAQT